MKDILAGIGAGVLLVYIILYIIIPITGVMF